MKKIMSDLLGVLVLALLLPACPAPPPIRYLHIAPNVVKIDLKNQGLCKGPLFIALESDYLTDWNEYFNYKEYAILDTGEFGYSDFYMNSADAFWSVSEECIIAISHANSVNADQGLIYYSPYDVPLAIHVKNLCTQEEFHIYGNLDTTNARLIPECKELLNGWDYRGESVPEKCLKAIPVTVTAEFSPATDFDWSQYPQWEQYRDYYDCEHF